jgi:hypothetical protein
LLGNYVNIFHANPNAGSNTGATVRKVVEMESGLPLPAMFPAVNSADLATMAGGAIPIYDRASGSLRC